MAAKMMATDQLYNSITDIMRKENPYTLDSIIRQVAKRAAADIVGSVNYLKQQKAKSGVRPLHFFDLPRELRDEIYSLIVTMAGPIYVDITHRRVKRDFENTHPYYVTARQPAVTRTSRALREESLKLFYQNNTFTFKYALHWNDIEYNSTAVNDWLKAIGHQKAAWVRSVVVRYITGSTWSLTVPGQLVPLQLAPADIAQLRSEEGLALVAHVMSFTRER